MSNFICFLCLLLLSGVLLPVNASAQDAVPVVDDVPAAINPDDALQDGADVTVDTSASDLVTDVKGEPVQEDGAGALPANPVAGADVDEVAAPDSSSEPIPVDPVISDALESFRAPINVLKMDSLFFTKWEHDLLLQARTGATVRPVVPGDAGMELLGLPADGAGAPSPREINLGGITYISAGNWTIWLNNTRVTPTALIPEIMDLKVYKDRIEIDWLDKQSNQIYPIRLRPHEKFNLDTRMFLPADG